MDEKNNVNNVCETEISASEADNSPGIVKIGDDVIASIATIVLSGIEGVHSASGNLASGIVEFLGVKKSSTKGIKVIVDSENQITVEIHVNVKYGYKIPDVAWEIQEKVKAEIETVTGLTVLKINVHVDGITVVEEKTEPVEEPLENSEATPAETEENINE